MITVKTIINCDIQKVWDCWTNPKHIKGWNFASPEWYCLRAENDVRAKVKFSWLMEAKDGNSY